MKHLIGLQPYVSHDSFSFELLINTNTTSDLNPPLSEFSILHSKRSNIVMQTFYFFMDLFLTQSQPLLSISPHRDKSNTEVTSFSNLD